MLYLILCIWETPKQVLLQTVKTQIQCCIMRHFIWVYIACYGKTDNQTKRIQYFFLNYNLTPLDMYNGLSQVYCLKPVGRILLYPIQWINNDSYIGMICT